MTGRRCAQRSSPALFTGMPARHAPSMPDSQPGAGPPETFHIRMNGDQPIRLPVAEMTPEDARLAITFQEHELAIMARIAAPTLMLLQQAFKGEHAMTPSELREAYELAATLIRVQEQTHRLREAVSRRTASYPGARV
jgi:hypothetical protein